MARCSETTSPRKPPPAGGSWRRAGRGFLAGLAVGLGACSGVTESGEPALSRFNLAYGPDPAQVLDLVLPAGRGSRTAVVVFIHGGAWYSGDKSVFTATDLQAFTDRGYACVNINYRLASTAANIHDPILSEDVSAAIEFVASRADEYQISATRFGVLGHSAGGQLSLLGAYRYNAAGRIRAVASLAGPADLTDPVLLAIPTAREVIENYLGVTQAEAPARWVGASPTLVASSGAPPTILLQGLLDPLVPFIVTEKLRDRLDDLAVPNQYVTFPAYTHDLGYLLFNRFPEDVWDPVLAWFDRYLK